MSEYEIGRVSDATAKACIEDLRQAVERIAQRLMSKPVRVACEIRPDYRLGTKAEAEIVGEGRSFAAFSRYEALCGLLDQIVHDYA